MKAVVRDFGAKTKPLLAGGAKLLFPPRCPACSAMVAEPHRLCASCWQTLHFISPPWCVLCGIPFTHATEDGSLCAACMQDPPPYDKARAALAYDAASRPLITRFKFSDKIDRLPGYVRLLQQASTPLLQEVDMIIPVPLHRRRLWQRKYNQAALLAHGLSQQSGVPVLADALLRVRHTTPQSGLSKAARQRNVQGAFQLNAAHKESLAGKRVLLVDDVITTGSTIEACCRALRRGGVAAIVVLTLARTLLTEQHDTHSITADQ